MRRLSRALSGATAVPTESTPLMPETEPDESQGFDYDVAFVFMNPDHEKGRHLRESKAKTYRHFISEISRVGLLTHTFYSVKKDMVFVLVGTDLKRFQEQADKMNLRVELDPFELQLRTNKHFQNVKKPDGDDLPAPPQRLGDVPKARWGQYRHIYAQYDTDPELQSLYKKAVGQNHPFRSTLRIRLLYAIISGESFRGGANIDVRTARAAAATCEAEYPYGTYGLLDDFPLHETRTLNALYEGWVVTWQWPSDQPLEKLRLYFGEKLGLYFGFLCHYTSWLGFLSIAGLIVTAHMIYVGLTTWDPNALRTVTYSVPVFAVYVCFWSILMLESFKNKQATWALQWGVADHQRSEEPRPEFVQHKDTKVVWSPVDGEPLYAYPRDERRRTTIFSFSIIAFAMAVVLGLIAACFVVKVMLVHDEFLEMVIPPALLAGTIQTLNLVWRIFAIALTDAENHQTETEYEGALVTKLYFFAFVNYYSPLYFMAFIQGYTEIGCTMGSCYNYLAFNVGILVMANIFVTNGIDLVLPVLLGLVKRFMAMRGVEQDEDEDVAYSTTELQFQMEAYDTLHDAIQDYTTMVVEFGYVVLFACAFPLAPALAYVNEYCQIRADGYKLCRSYKRCKPVIAADIGSWQGIYTLTTYAAVISNAGIVCFTMDIIPFSGATKVWIFLGFQYFVVLCMSIVDIALPDVPEDVEIQHERRDFFEKYIIQKFIVEEDNIDLTRFKQVPAEAVAPAQNSRRMSYHRSLSETYTGSVL